MASAFEQALGVEVLQQKVFGWVNVPADCVRPLQKIHLHPARPEGMNEPTQAGVDGARKILEYASKLEADDVCVILLSGGGSALLPAPVPQISLDDKQAVTRFLMHAGATIDELNCVRKQLSLVKGGRLARATRAGRVFTLIISDVVGDPLEIIASGPTVVDSSTAADALNILNQYANTPSDVPQPVWDYLAETAQNAKPSAPIPATVVNTIIGNNVMALTAAAARAEQLGYRVHSLGSENRGEAQSEGRELAKLCTSIRDEGRPCRPAVCILSGGEPVVRLAKTDQPRKGGRNQELVLAALEQLWDDGMKRLVLLSGGTDGEDGPTDAAGAVADAEILKSARSQQLIPAKYLAINNSYAFFERSGGLLKTGPTHTNVMDVRVALIAD
jgi:hydroxypyruvate reductase